MTADPSAHRSILSQGWAASGSPARCHNKRPEAGRRGNDVCLRNFWRAHKGWTLLPVSHWRSAQGRRSRHEPRTGNRYHRRTFFFFLSRTSKKPKLRRRFGVFLAAGGTKWTTKEAKKSLLFLSGRTEPLGGTRKCERRALRRLRCRESKLAAHLGCRSHRWKMPTSCPSFSSGKCLCPWLHLKFWSLNTSCAQESIRILPTSNLGSVLTS